MAIPTALGVVSLVFLLQPLIPGDPVDFLLGEQVTLADREELRRAYDLDKPLIQQYLISVTTNVNLNTIIKRYFFIQGINFKPLYRLVLKPRQLPFGKSSRIFLNLAYSLFN